MERVLINIFSVIRAFNEKLVLTLVLLLLLHKLINIQLS